MFSCCYVRASDSTCIYNIGIKYVFLNFHNNDDDENVKHFQIYAIFIIFFFFFCVFCLFFPDITHSLRCNGFPPKMIFYTLPVSLVCRTFFHNKYQTIVVSFWQWRTLTKRTICRKGFNPVVLIVYILLSSTLSFFFYLYIFLSLSLVSQITYFSMFIARINRVVVVSCCVCKLLSFAHRVKR